MDEHYKIIDKTGAVKKWCEQNDMDIILLRMKNTNSFTLSHIIKIRGLLCYSGLEPKKDFEFERIK